MPSSTWHVMDILCHIHRYKISQKFSLSAHFLKLLLWDAYIGCVASMFRTWGKFYQILYKVLELWMNCTALMATLLCYFLKKGWLRCRWRANVSFCYNLIKQKEFWQGVPLALTMEKTNLWKFWFEKYCFYKIYIRWK